ncbi:MAG: glycosyltransferase [Candidatus Eisenbacteria bacterium]|nr:glycosyltransferase [Candidatus Eisenbacteria bacterium]
MEDRFALGFRPITHGPAAGAIPERGGAAAAIASTAVIQPRAPAWPGRARTGTMERRMTQDAIPSHDPDFRVLVVTNMYPGPSAPEWGIFIADQVRSLQEWLPVRVIAKRNRGSGAYLPFSLRSAWASLAGDFDLVHAHYGFHSALVPALFASQPLVVTFHGSDALLEPRRHRLYARLQRRIVRRADRVIAVSGEVAARLIEELGAEPGKVAQIPCGVDTVLFRPGDRAAARRALGIEPDAHLVLFVGRRSKMKGLELLRMAAARMPEVAFHFVGEGEIRWEAPNCRFWGARPHAEIAEWLRAADVLALPSYSEGTPVTVLEALATERTVVCSRVGACPELIAQARAGFLFEPGDVDGLVAGLREALSGGQDLSVGRDLIKERFDLAVIAKRLVSLYKEVAEEKGAR